VNQAGSPILVARTDSIARRQPGCREGHVVTIWEWLTALMRRWPFVLIGLLCTLVAVYLVHKRPIAYQACGSVTVGAPRTKASPNVYYSQQASLVAVTGLATEQVMSQQVQDRLSADGLTAGYQAQVLNTGSSETPAYSVPEMDMCASSYSSEMSERTAKAVIGDFDAFLRSRQAASHVPRRYFLTETEIAAPLPEPVTGRPSQAYLGVGAIGLIITGAGTLWIDQFLRRRSSVRTIRRAG
jgi:hypothetical protein